MNTINFYGKEYAILTEIVCDCGCKFKKDNSIGLLSFSNIFLCENHKPKIDLEKKLKDLKDLKIKEIKNKTGEIIRSKYPEYTQINILNGIDGYTTTDKTNCKNFINSMITQGRAFQLEVETLTTIEELDDYTYEFEV